MSQNEGVSWEDPMNFNEQNLVHAGWTSDEEEGDGDDDIQLVAETGHAKEAIGSNVHEESVAQNASVDHQEGEGLLG